MILLFCIAVAVRIIMILRRNTKRQEWHLRNDMRNGHAWLEFGTSYYDTYYPQFVFAYQPKEPR